MRWIIRFRDKCNECGVESLIHPPKGSMVFNDLNQISPQKFKERDIEFH